MSRLLCFLLLTILAETLAKDSNSNRARVGERSWRGTEVISEIQRNGRRGTHDAFEVIQAEDYSNKTAKIFADTTADGVFLIYIRDGASIGYFDVDFGTGANRVEFHVQELIYPPAGKGGMMYLHVGSPTHTPSAAVTIGYNPEYYKYATLSQYLDTVPKGVLDLYLTFTAEYGTDFYTTNLNYFQFF